MAFKKGESGNPDKKFKKGQSGNPAGYPAGVPNRSTSAKKWLGTSYSFAHPVTGKTEKGTIEDAATIAQVQKALDGDTGAYRELMDAAHGKVANIIAGPDGGPVQVVSHDLTGLSLEEKRTLLAIRRKLAQGKDAAPNG
jgi:hypothetical protein